MIQDCLMTIKENRIVNHRARGIIWTFMKDPVLKLKMNQQLLQTRIGLHTKTFRGKRIAI
jgi:hypothetical protein